LGQSKSESVFDLDVDLVLDAKRGRKWSQNGPKIDPKTDENAGLVSGTLAIWFGDVFCLILRPTKMKNVDFALVFVYILSNGPNLNPAPRIRSGAPFWTNIWPQMCPKWGPKTDRKPLPNLRWLRLPFWSLFGHFWAPKMAPKIAPRTCAAALGALGGSPGLLPDHL
jgi:hypothetical protein